MHVYRLFRFVSDCRLAGGAVGGLVPSGACPVVSAARGRRGLRVKGRPEGGRVSDAVAPLRPEGRPRSLCTTRRISLPVLLLPILVSLPGCACSGVAVFLGRRHRCRQHWLASMGRALPHAKGQVGAMKT